MEYDLVVVGAGSGGLAAVQRAASYGAKCAVIESGPLGGTCVNVGCVPKKVMWFGASVAHTVSHDAESYGFTIPDSTFTFDKLKRSRDDYVSGINGRYADALENAGIDLYLGHARMSGPNTVDIDGKTLSSTHTLIATGGRPIVPNNVTGADLGITSDGFFKLETLPGKVVVAGSGYIAVELAGMLNAFGSEVHMLVRKQSVLRRFDSTIRNLLTEQLISDGIKIHIETEAQVISRNSDHTLNISCDTGLELEGVDEFLWAVGREPNIDSLRLDLTGVELDSHGFIPVDAYQNTNVANVYAVGDVTGCVALTPVAVAAGRRLMDRVFGGKAGRKLDFDNIATVVFSHPPIATIGLTEEDARAQFGDDVKVYQAKFKPMYYAFSSHPKRTAVKLITHGANEKIIGCHVIGHGADEMMQGFAVAIRIGANKSDFDDTVAIHPTSAEELVTLR